MNTAILATAIFGDMAPGERIIVIGILIAIIFFGGKGIWKDGSKGGGSGSSGGSSGGSTPS